MRQLVVQAFMSLDGVMQAPGAPEEDPSDGFAWGGWSARYWDGQLQGLLAEEFAREHELVLGRRTYEIFAAHWPFAPDDNPIAVRLNEMTKHVASRTLTGTDWRGARLLDGDAVPAVAGLKTQDGPDLQTQGSGELVRGLLAAGLVDRLDTYVFPVLLGAGKRFFDPDTRPSSLTVRSHQVSGQGVMVTSYQVSGPVGVGSMQHEQPSEAELRRRAGLAR
jgi:dihydrofolate reductase